MKGQLWLGLLGLALLAIGCSSGDSGTEASLNQPVTPQSQPFAEPLVRRSLPNQSTRPVPGLLQSTNARTRASSVITGRRDPFAVIPGQTPIVVSAKRTASNQVSVTPLPTQGSVPPNRLPSIPLPPGPVQAAPLPNLASAPLPPVAVPNAPVAPIAPPSRTALADSIQVSGVVQVSGRWSVIVKEPTASSSRHVAVGDYLENGKVLVKKIVSPGSTDPVVVLQQGGVEVRKSLV